MLSFTAVFVTDVAFTTVNESAMDVQFTVSLNVNTIVFTSVLAAVNVGTAALAVPVNNPKITKAIRTVNIKFLVTLFFIILFPMKIIFR